MPTFKYACSVCGHQYEELRSTGEEQLVTTCNTKTCTGTYEELN